MPSAGARVTSGLFNIGPSSLKPKWFAPQIMISSPWSLGKRS